MLQKVFVPAVDSQSCRCTSLTASPVVSAEYVKGWDHKWYVLWQPHAQAHAQQEASVPLLDANHS